MIKNTNKKSFSSRESSSKEHSGAPKRGGADRRKFHDDKPRSRKPRNFEEEETDYQEKPRPRKFRDNFKDKRQFSGHKSQVSDDEEPRPRRNGFKGRRPQVAEEETPRRNNFKGRRSQNSEEETPRRNNFKERRSRVAGRQSQLTDEEQQQATSKSTSRHSDTVRLNKYIANAGICSRREADVLIAAGSVKVNGEVMTQMGYQVKPGDVVSYGGETLRSEAKRYFLLNKPKGFITTLDDPQERQTVMMLMDGACNERIYPVGRLDRNTTGLLLFTNDGELAKKLTHPSTQVYKIYQVELNKPVTKEDMRQMLEGIELEDGPIHVDDVQYVETANDRRVVGVELHSGRNRIVRRIFEHLGYDVHKLDRVVFAGLTKKDLPRGRYRELTPQEVGFLKMI